MGTRVTMASHETINNAANNAGLENYTYNQAYALFEAGMVSILREVAVRSLLEMEAEELFEYPAEHKRLVEEHAAVFKKISDMLPPKQQPLINELEDLESKIKTTELDDYFIRGFIEGYRFLRNLNSSYRGELLNVRQ